MKLGRVQSKADARTLWLEHYVTQELPSPPQQEYLEANASWPMLGNDRFNCCTSAAAGHMVHHWTAANGSSILLTDEDILRAHAQLTGDHLLECVTMLDALKLWRRIGIGEHRIHAFVSAQPKDAAQLRQIIYLFGAAYVGLDLPNFVCGPDPLLWPEAAWVMPAEATAEAVAPQSENGHCVTAIGYDEDGVYVVTWGRMKVMSWEFYERFNFETYAVLSADWVDRDRTSPSGFSSQALLRDLHSVEAVGQAAAGATAAKHTATAC
jgi:hypothetical protein